MDNQITTIYYPVDGKFWFPVKTLADDTLPFSGGVQRVRYTIDYANYKRFSAEATITYGDEIASPEAAPESSRDSSQH